MWKLGGPGATGSGHRACTALCPPTAAEGSGVPSLPPPRHRQSATWARCHADGCHDQRMPRHLHTSAVPAAAPSGLSRRSSLGPQGPPHRAQPPALERAGSLAPSLAPSLAGPTREGSQWSGSQVSGSHPTGTQPEGAEPERYNTQRQSQVAAQAPIPPSTPPTMSQGVRVRDLGGYFVLHERRWGRQFGVTPAVPRDRRPGTCTRCKSVDDREVHQGTMQYCNVHRPHWLAPLEQCTLQYSKSVLLSCAVQCSAVEFQLVHHSTGQYSHAPCVVAGRG